MADTAAPAYPLDACNANGPYPQDVAIRWAAYEGSANVPDSGVSETVTITTEDLHLDVAVSDAEQGSTYTADPGDGTAVLDIEIGFPDGVGGAGHYYAAAGTYHVVVARDGTTIAEQDVTATDAPVRASGRARR